jgi:hypothetical protein
MRQTKVFGGYHGCILARFADEHIRAPLLGERHEVGCPEPRADSAEEPGVDEAFGFETRGQGVAMGLELLVFGVRSKAAAYREKVKARSLYHRPHGTTRGEGYGVAPLLEGLGEGHQRVKMAVAARHAKQETPRYLTS